MVNVVPHLYDVTALHKTLCRKLFLTRNSADSIVRLLKYLRNPAQSNERKSAASFVMKDRDNFAEFRSTGYMPYAATNSAILDSALDDAEAYFEQQKNTDQLEGLRDKANKGYLVSLLEGLDFLEHPALFRFITSRHLIDHATDYFGSVPLLSHVSLSWSPVCDVVTGSQLFHLDEEDDRQIKLFINVTPCRMDGGPLTLFSAGESKRLREKLRHRRGRVTDEDIDRAGPSEPPIVLTGPCGTGAWVDTSRCLHYGSRGNSIDRLMLIVQFTHHLAPKINTSHWYRGLDPWMAELDSIQKLTLGIR